MGPGTDEGDGCDPHGFRADDRHGRVRREFLSTLGRRSPTRHGGANQKRYTNDAVGDGDPSNGPTSNY